MLLSVLPLWGSLLALVASQSCPDPSENGASWVRLKPLGQCKDGESTCPYRITLPPLTIQLPKPFRELEKMARELQSLTEIVDRLREDCRECKERRRTDWSESTDDESEDGERIQASEETLSTKDSQQDIAQREHTVQGTTSRSAVDGAVIISSDAKDETPTADLGRWNTNQERNVNPRTTKPRSEKIGATKGSKPSQDKTASGSIRKVGEVPSVTTGEKEIPQFPMDTRMESSIPKEQSGQQSQDHPNTKKAGNEMYPETLTATGKVKSIPEYYVVTMTTEVDVDDDDDYDDYDDDDDVETKQTPNVDNVPVEKQPTTGTDSQSSRELEPRSTQFVRKQQEKVNKQEVANTGLKGPRTGIFDDTTSGNVSKDGGVRVIQQPTLKNVEKGYRDERPTKTKVLKPGSHSESKVNSRPGNIDDTIREEKELTSSNTGRVNVSQINPQTLEIKSKSTFKSESDPKIDTGLKSKFNTSGTVSGQVMATSTISGATYGIVDVSPTNPQTLDIIKRLNAGTESGISVNPADRVSRVKNTGPHDGVNARPEVDVINPKIQKGKFKTPSKPGTELEGNNGMDSNPVNNSRLSISGVTDGVVVISYTNPQIFDGKNQEGTNLDAGIESKPIKNTDTIIGINNLGLSDPDSVNVKADTDLKNQDKQSSNSQTSLETNKNTNRRPEINPVTGIKILRAPVSGITDDVVDIPANPQTEHGKDQVKTGTDSENVDKVVSKPVNNIKTDSGQDTSGSPNSDIIYGVVDVSPTNPQTLDIIKRLNAGTESGISLDPNDRDNTGSHDGVNVRPDVDVINPKIQKGKFKPGTELEGNNGMDLNPVNISRLSISGVTDGVVVISHTNPQILEGKNQEGTNLDAGIESKPIKNTYTIIGINNLGLSDPDRLSVKADSDLKNPIKQSSNSQTSLQSNKNTNRSTEIDSNLVNGMKTSRAPISGIDNLPNPQTEPGKNQVKAGTDSENDDREVSKPVDNIRTAIGQDTSGSPNSDIAYGVVDVNPTNHQIDRTSHSETVSQQQTPKSPFLGITNASAGKKTYPGTSDGTFEPFINKNTKTDVNSHNVETNRSLEIPQLSIPDKPDAQVGVNQINDQTVNDNTKKTTTVSTPVNNAETESRIKPPKSPFTGRSNATSDQRNPQGNDRISRKPFKPSENTEVGIHPNRHPIMDTVNPREIPESSSSDSRHEANGTNPSLHAKYDPSKRRFLPRPKLNMTHPRNGRIKIPNPVSIDNERRKEQGSNTTTSLRNDVKENGRRQPIAILPTSLEKQREIKHQPERTNTGGVNINKDPRRRKPHIPLNESKAFGSGGTRNTSRVNDYIISKTVPSTNNEFNGTVYSIWPTLAPKGVGDKSHIKRTTAPPAVHPRVSHQTESTSQATSTSLIPENTGDHSGQNLGRNSKPLVEVIKDNRRRTQQAPFKPSTGDSNLEKPKKSLREGSDQHLGGKPPEVVKSNERNELNYATTAATPYTVNTEFKNKPSKIPQFTAPIITTAHLMDQDDAEQAKTASGVKVSNKQAHHRLEKPSQGIESKTFHSDSGNKELQSASNGQGSSATADLQPNSLDSIQNGANGSTALILDKVKAGSGSRAPTTSTEHTRENRPRDTNTVAMDKVETATEAIPLIPSADNAPVTYQKYTTNPLRSTDLVGGNKEKPLIDNNNGNFYSIAVNKMTETSLDQMPAGHASDGSNKKPLNVNHMDDKQSREKQLLSNCHGQCDLGPTPQSILDSHESSKDNRDKLPQDCSDFMENAKSGIYEVTPRGSGNTTFPVFCDMTSSGGGWTLIQRRFNGSVSFNRTWNDYKKGFGNLKGDLWLGNDKIHWLTTTKAMVLRIELEDLDGIKEHAQYDHFHVANESQFYRLTIDGYSGTAGDAMLYSKKFNHNQRNFTTPDRDNDRYTSGNCGAYYSSGWWFDACMAANLNGKYYETRYKGVRNGIFWGTWHNIPTESYPTNYRQSFKTVRMMIRPRTGLLVD